MGVPFPSQYAAPLLSRLGSDAGCGLLVWYHSDAEYMDLLADYWKRPEERATIAQRGQALVRQQYGRGRQFGTLLRHLQGAGHSGVPAN
jgi:hypothetical protein